jgi:hypothetical protein
LSILADLIASRNGIVLKAAREAGRSGHRFAKDFLEGT